MKNRKILYVSVEESEEQQSNKIQFLDSILQELPENYRSVLELRFLKGYSILETADAMGVTEENAKVLQHRALKKANQLSADSCGQ